MHSPKGKEIIITTNIQNESTSFSKSEISLTAYKTYLLFKMLLVKPFSKEEINEHFKDDPIIAKKFHSDSVANSINTLRAIGCCISRPSLSNNYTYVLHSHPFKFELSQKQINLLGTIRQSLSNQTDWRLLYKINNLYKKIINNSIKQSYYEELEKNDIFTGISSEILSQLDYHAKNKNKITISYRSPINDFEDLSITVNDLFIENDRLYLWCYSHKYKDVSYLRIDKIKEIKSVEIKAPKIILDKTKVKYRLKDNSIETFIAQDEEKVIERCDDYIIIEAAIISKFNFFQRILSFGQDCTIFEPEEIRTEFIKYLDNISERYR